MGSAYYQHAYGYPYGHRHSDARADRDANASIGDSKGDFVDQELREEFKRINDKLDALASLPEKVSGLHANFLKHVDDDRIFLLGEGDSPGLVIKVDRLERAWAQHQKFFYILATAVAGVLCEGAWRLVVSLTTKG